MNKLPKLLGVICSFAILSSLMYGEARTSSSLIREWINAKPDNTVSGVYNNRCAAFSDENTSYTGLISIVFTRSDINKIPIKSEIKQVELLQAMGTIKVRVVDIDGALVATRILEEGRDYSVRGVEIIIPENWSAGDEWGSAMGTTVNSLLRTTNGHLLVRSTNKVKRRQFLFPTLKEVVYYFKFEEINSPKAQMQ